jgi:carboxymethylenebutenolidase
MQSSTVDIPTPDGVADAYLSQPSDEATHPGVLFLMDGIGLRPRIKEMADRIADRGYVVLAPNVFYRAGRAPVLPLPDFFDPDARGEFMKSVRPLVEQLTPEALSRDGGAYLDYLGGLAPGPTTITGYCTGGRLGWRITVAHPDRVSALAGFHAGGLVTDTADSPHLSAPDLRAELYFGHSDQDPSMTAEQIEALERALESADLKYRSEVYEGAGHGYTMSDTPAYNETAAERHFEELFALLERTVGREGPTRSA